MNQPKENADKYFKHHLDDIAYFFKAEFKTEPEQLYVYNTLHWKITSVIIPIYYFQDSHFLKFLIFAKWLSWHAKESCLPSVIILNSVIVKVNFKSILTGQNSVS